MNTSLFCEQLRQTAKNIFSRQNKGAVFHIRCCVAQKKGKSKQQQAVLTPLQARRARRVLVSKLAACSSQSVDLPGKLGGATSQDCTTVMDAAVFPYISALAADAVWLLKAHMLNNTSVAKEL